MERKVGEIFEYNGEWYQCVEQPKQCDCAIVCELCAFSAVRNCELDECSGTYRSDSKSVIFKKLEKVGEPYKGEGKIFQPYQAYIIPVPKWDYEFFMLLHQETKIIDIEVKQNKENMKEKKLNLKPFDLEAAKAGKLVCTRDGRKARIISFDRHGEDCPIIALVVDSKNAECEEVIDYTLDGICNENIINHNKYDLMMFTRKKEGWLNIFKDFEDTVCCVYPTEKEALEDGEIEKDYITTIKIEWEE